MREARGQAIATQESSALSLDLDRRTIEVAGGGRSRALPERLDIKLDTGRYPTTQEGLGALMTAPSGVANWNGPYLKDPKQLKDPWSRDFAYRSPAEKGGFDLGSLGADGKEGGDGENKDVHN